jgi:hypothetical protein
VDALIHFKVLLSLVILRGPSFTNITAPLEALYKEKKQRREMTTTSAAEPTRGIEKSLTGARPVPAEFES